MKKVFEISTYVMITVLAVLSGTFVIFALIGGNAADWGCAAVLLGFGAALMYLNMHVISKTPDEESK